MKKLVLLFSLLSTISFAQNGFSYEASSLTVNFSPLISRTAFVKDNAGNRWFGFKGGPYTLIKFDNTTWTNYQPSISTPVVSLAADANGNVWIGTLNGGLIKYDGSTFTSFKRSNSAIISDSITSLACINNKIYAGSYKGFSEFDGTSFTNYNKANSGISSDSVFCFAPEGAQIWIGTKKGLNNFSGTTISYIGSNDQINDIMVDGNNTKWLGTETSGLFKYDNSSFSNINTLIPLIIGGNVPAKVLSIGRSTSNNPIIGLVNPLIYNAPRIPALMEITGNNTYRYYVLPNFMDGSAIFNKSNFGSLTFTSTKKIYGPVVNMMCYGFMESQYNPAAAISSITPDNTQFLDINEVSAGCNPNADIHRDGCKGLYEVPKGSGKKTTLGSSFWMGGYTNGTLNIGASTYRMNNFIDYWPGPINTSSGTTDTATAQQFNHVWKINRLDIENFKYHYLQGNVQSGLYPIPGEIATWPGNGTVPGEMLAPYFDYNSDQQYNPMDGDYPLIKGDQMLWWVFNDALAPHTLSGSATSMHVQVEASAYAYTCPTVADSDKVINYTTFYNYRIINKSSNVLDSVCVGMDSDVDLGYYNDDYLGCDVQNNFGFVHNADSIDENGPGISGYLTNLPYFSYNILQGPSADIGDGLDNDKDGCIDCTFQLGSNGQPDINLSPYDELTKRENTSMHAFLPYNNDGNAKTGNPTTTGNGLQYYRYLNAIWKDGLPMTYDAGNGTSPTGIPCLFAYPGSSDPIGYGVGGSPANPIVMPPWGEGNSTTNNQPGDRRFLTSTGRFTMLPGETKELDFAYVFTQDSISLVNGTLYNKVVSDNRKVKNWFRNNNAPSCLDLSSVGLDDTFHKPDVQVYPNPANNQLTVNVGKDNTIQKLKIYDILGKELISKESVNSSKLQVDITLLSDAVYLLEVRSEQGSYFSKFIKQ